MDCARVESAVVSAVVWPLRLMITMTRGKMPRPKPSRTAGMTASETGRKSSAATPAVMVRVAM